MNHTGLTLLAVDDEQAQLNDLARLLRGFPLVRDVECASNPREALSRLSTEPFDAVFLDVRMPGLDGLELARVIRRFRERPSVVFVSAYDASAVDAFELEAVDYLRKPVSRRRAEQALERVIAARAAAPALGAAGHEAEPAGEATLSDGLVAVANPRTGSTQLLGRQEIVYVQAQGDFVRIVAPGGRYLIRSTLSEVESRWAQHGFVRVHRQFVVNLHHAREIRPQFGSTAELVMEEGSVVPIARRHLADLQRRLRP